MKKRIIVLLLCVVFAINLSTPFFAVSSKTDGFSSNDGTNVNTNSSIALAGRTFTQTTVAQFDYDYIPSDWDLSNIPPELQFIDNENGIFRLVDAAYPAEYSFKYLVDGNKIHIYPDPTGEYGSEKFKFATELVMEYIGTGTLRVDGFYPVKDTQTELASGQVITTHYTLGWTDIDDLFVCGDEPETDSTVILSGKRFVQITNTEQYSERPDRLPYIEFINETNGKIKYYSYDENGTGGAGGTSSFSYKISGDKVSLYAGYYYIGDYIDEIVLRIIDQDRLEVIDIKNYNGVKEMSLYGTDIGDVFEIQSDTKEEIKPTISGVKDNYTITQGDSLNINGSLGAGGDGLLNKVTLKHNLTGTTFTPITIELNGTKSSVQLDEYFKLSANSYPLNTVGTHEFIIYASADNYTKTDNLIEKFTVTVEEKKHENTGRITKDDPCTYENVFKAMLQILEDKNAERGWYTDDFLLLVMTTAWQESSWQHYNNGNVKITINSDKESTKDIGIMQLNNKVLHDESGDWLVAAITDDWVYNLEYGIGNIWQGYLQSKRKYTDEDSRARGAYSRYNGGPTAGVNRWENGEYNQDLVFYENYKVFKEWFKGNSGNVSGYLKEIYEIFLSLHGKLSFYDIPVENVTFDDYLKITVFDSSMNVISAETVLNGKYNVKIENVPNDYVDSVCIELAEVDSDLIYSIQAMKTNGNEYWAEFDTNKMQNSKYRLAAFAWFSQKVNNKSYTSSDYWNFSTNTEYETNFVFKLNGELINEYKLVKLTIEEAKRVEITPVGTSCFDYNLNPLPLVSISFSSMSSKCVLGEIYSESLPIFYNHIISNIPIGKHNVHLSTNVGDSYNFTIEVYDNSKDTIEITASKISGKVFQQNDKSNNWYKYPYGNGDPDGDGVNQAVTIGESGCGILALTNAVYYMNGVFIDPRITAQYAVDNKYRFDGGFSAELYAMFANSVNGKQYKFSVTSVPIFTKDDTSWWETITQHLSKGGTVIGNVPGHIIAIVDYDEKSDKCLVYDSYASKKRGTSKDGNDWKSKKELSTEKLSLSWFITISSTQD